MKKLRKITYAHRALFAPARILARGISYARGKRKYRADMMRLEAFRNRHKGQRCFIVATGPSLTAGDLEMISGEICFGVNACVRLFDKTRWRPTYYGITDRRVFAQLKREIHPEALNTVFFADTIPLEPGPNAYRFLLNEAPMDYEGTFWQKLFSLPPAGFSADITQKRVSSGGTVAYAMLQIAAFMGFSEICLLGVDCNYTGPVRHACGTERAKTPAKCDAKDLRTGERMLESFAVARAYADKHGLTIYNATRGGKLEAFVRRTPEEILRG